VTLDANAIATSHAERRPIADFFRELFIVARYEIASLALSVRALLLIVGYGVTAGAVGAFYLWLDKTSEGKLSEFTKKAGELSDEQKEQIVSQLAKTVGRPLANAIFNGDLPPLVLTVLLLSTFAIPGLVLLVGYSGIADDLSTRFARYILQRVRRPSYLFGKLLGHFVVGYAAVILVHVLLLAYATTIEGFELDKVLPALPRIWAAMAFFMLGYVAFTAFFSATISPPFAAFAVGGLALVFFWIMSFFPYIGEVWMGSWHMRLWALDPAAIGVYLAHAVFFGVLAYLGIRMRDV
jgi:hypothetical protein